MNQSKWNAYHIARAIAVHAPNGVSIMKVRELIERTCGNDKRTINKYQRILMVNKYLIEKDGKFIANPNLGNMTPKSPKQLLEEWED